MLWLGVDLTAVIPFLVVYQPLIFASCNVFKIIWLELLPTQLSIHLKFPVRKTFHWLPIEHRSIFRTCLLVYKFPYGGYSKYLYLSLDLDIVSITHVNAKLIVCSLRSHTLSLSVYKSSKQFGLSFAYDAPKICNALPDDVRSATSLHPFRNKLKTYLFAQAYPP